MQSRMQKYQLTREQFDALLQKEELGHLGTIDAKGFPYITPVHFVYLDDKIYIHGLAKGEKVANIRDNAKVCFQVQGPYSYIQAEAPCDTNTSYQSVIIRGSAGILDNRKLCGDVLDAIVKKYTPQHVGRDFPEAMLKMTGVIAITIEERTGKYYDGIEK